MTRTERDRREAALVRAHWDALDAHERAYRLGEPVPEWVVACFNDGKWPPRWTPPTDADYERADREARLRVREMDDANARVDAREAYDADLVAQILAAGKPDPAHDADERARLIRWALEVR